MSQSLEKTIASKVGTYDLARQMEGAHKVKCSEFATAIIENLYSLGGRLSSFSFR